MRTLVTYVTEVTELATQIWIRKARIKILDKEVLDNYYWYEISFDGKHWQRLSLKPGKKNQRIQPHPFLRRNLAEMQRYCEAMNRIGQGETWLFDAVKVDDIIYITRVHGPSPFSTPYEKMEENIRKLKNQPVEVLS